MAPRLRLSAFVCVLVALLVPGQVSAGPVVVLGQPDFVTAGCTTGGPSDSSLFRPIGAAVNAAGNVYVAEVFNSRVLVYLDPPAAELGECPSWLARRR